MGHKAFPLVLALWFAALVGLGSLVVPTALVERVVVALGLPSLLSFAAPPLGVKAKIAIALAGGIGGALLGLLLGRQLYRSGRAPERAVSPINAHEELGANGLDGEDEEPLEVFVEAEHEPEDAALPAEEDFEEEAWDLVWLDEEEDAIAPAPAPEPVAEEQPDETPPEAESEPEVDMTEPQPAAPQEQTASELADLSLMQLAQRLQGAISAHRALRAAAPVVPLSQARPVNKAEVRPPEATCEAEEITDLPAPQEFSADDSVDTPKDTPVDTGDQPEASAVYHPAYKPFTETGDLIAQDEDDLAQDEMALGETYSSLLSMTASVRAAPEQLREDEPEPEASPSSRLATLDRFETAPQSAVKIDPQEDALRKALMNLHQFSQNS